MSLLMKHNIPVYKAFCKCLAKYHECILITATGTGKSYIVEEFLQQHDEVALVVVPKRTIKSSWEDLSSKVTVITYQSFARHYEDYINLYRYVVFDEAHHIGGDGPWGMAFRDFKKRSDLSYFIGLTADAIRYSDQNKDVAQREFDGHIVYGYNAAEAVEKGILPNAQYVSALFDLPNIRDTLYSKAIRKSNAKKYREKVETLFGRLDMEIENTESIEEILKEHLSRAGRRKGIIFVDSIKYTDTGIDIIRDTFKDEPVLTCHSKMNAKENEIVLTRFKKMDHGYIVAVDMFNEGLHIKGVNTIIMLRKTRSPSIYQQQVGRALSSANPNELVYVFDFVGNAAAIIEHFLKDDYKDPITEGVTPTNETLSKPGESKQPDISDQIIVDDTTKQIAYLLRDIRNLISRKEFTKEECDFIRENVGSHAITWIARALGRPYGSVLQKIKAMGLDTKPIPIVEPPKPAPKPTVKQDIEIIQESIPRPDINKVHRILACNSYEGAQRELNTKYPGCFDPKQLRDLLRSYHPDYPAIEYQLSILDSILSTYGPLIGFKTIRRKFLSSLQIDTLIIRAKELYESGQARFTYDNLMMIEEAQ